MTALAALLAAGCAWHSGALLPSTQNGALPQTVATPMPEQYVAFWQSWSDTSKKPFARLGTIPRSVTTVDVAFSVANGNAIAPPQNTYSLKNGIHAIHSHGGKVMLSFGGADSKFEITNPNTFENNLAHFYAKHGAYDGVDFDDERIPRNGQQQLIDLIQRTRARFSSKLLTYDAFGSGASLPYSPHDYQGEDVAIIQQAGPFLDWVNVMDYDAYGWKPPDHPNCTWSKPSAKDNCYKDVMNAFAAIPYPKNRLVMGLLIGKADDGKVITPQDAHAYAAWAKAQGFRGVMIWDINLDGAPYGATGAYSAAIASALGT